MTRPIAGAVAGCALVAMACGASASADSFTPVAMRVSVSPIGRLNGPLPITVSVSADPSVLDTAAPLRVRVKLAAECGGDFTHTAGVTLLDRELKPQPDPGEPYQGAAAGSGRPSAYGVQSVCAFVEQEGDNRVYAHDTDSQVNVTQACTSAARRYDVSAAALHRARAALARARGSAERRRLGALVTKRRTAAIQAQRSATFACGRDLPL